MYFIAIFVASVVFATAAVPSQRRFGKKGLASVWVLATVLFVGAGYLEWRGLGSRETPLQVSVALGSVPTLLSAAMIAFLDKNDFSPYGQWAAAVIVCCLASVPAAVLGLLLTP